MLGRVSDFLSLVIVITSIINFISLINHHFKKFTIPKPVLF